MLCSSSCWIFQSEFLGSKGVLHCDKKRQEGSQVKFVVNTHSKKSSLEKLDSFDLILKIF
jgi:hypothetical protein